jgi:galactokinase
MALSRRHSLRRGVIALLDGHDNVEGLSSSAATGVAYLLALEAANGLALPPEENVELDRIVENDYVGLNNGILDQSVILMSRPGHLTHIDCLDGRCRLVPLGGGQEVSVAVLFSGLRRPLAQTDYNRRVAECAEAAAFLLRAAGLQVPARPRLRAVPRDAHLEHAGRMPERLRRRAEHFFSEQERVRQGLRLWRAGDLDGFGRLMSESGRSSIENYECGNAYLRAAYEALRDSPGVFGARFSGAGFRGCCVGLARPECEGEIARSALSRYVAACPDMAGKAEVYFCRPGRAAQLLP